MTQDGLRVPPPEHNPADRRGWGVLAYGHPLDVPATGAPYATDCPSGEPDPETPAGHRSSATPLAPPGDRPYPGITDSQLAVLLRQTQWALADAAHDFPAGRGTPQRREELAETLEALAAIVRASALDGAGCVGERISEHAGP